MNETKANLKRIIDRVLKENEDEQILVMPIDHSAAIGSEEVTNEPEVIDHGTGKVVKISDRQISLSESRLRAVVRSVMSKALS